MTVGGIANYQAISQELGKLKETIADSSQLTSALKNTETSANGVSTDFSDLLQNAVKSYSADTGTDLSSSDSANSTVSALLQNLTAGKDTSTESALKTSESLLSGSDSTESGTDTSSLMSLYQKFVESSDGKKDIGQLVNGVLSGMVFGSSDDTTSQNSNMNTLMTAISGTDTADTDTKE